MKKITPLLILIILFVLFCGIINFDHWPNLDFRSESHSKGVLELDDRYTSRGSWQLCEILLLSETLADLAARGSQQIPHGNDLPIRIAIGD